MLNFLGAEKKKKTQKNEAVFAESSPAAPIQTLEGDGEMKSNLLIFESLVSVFVHFNGKFLC